MKIVFVTHDSANEVGGVLSWLQRLLPFLKIAGFEIEIHVLVFGNSPGVFCAWLQKEDISFRWKQWEEDTIKAVRNCLELIEESQPDIYVPNCILPAYYAAGYARRQGVHTVGVLHSDDHFYWGIVDEFVNGALAFRLSAVVAVSKFLQEAVIESAKNYNGAIQRIGCGVPISKDFAKPATNVFRLVYVGRLVEEQKRISEVTHALCSVIKQNASVEAWIVGDGGARSEVEKIILSSGVDLNRIKLLGRVDVSAIYSVLCKCQAFVLLSDYEGLPVSMLEAMAAGVVPICLDMRSGIREAIQPGFNGLIVGDRKEDFNAAVQTLQKDVALWSKLSANAQATVKEQFSEKSCADLWIELINSFDKKKRTRPVKPPFFLRLPRKNAKFGHYDQRRFPFSKGWSHLRIMLGYYRRKIMKPFGITS